VDAALRKRICDDLEGIVRGEVLFDDLSRTLYASDASLFEVMPAGVVVPRDEEDVRAIVRYAFEHQVPLIPRGAGTGLAGESLGSGVILDLSVHFRAIPEVGSDFVRVQPGVVRRELEEVLAQIGRRFAPDPGSWECTVGGMLATNASGPRAYRHGYVRDHVADLRVVFDNGDAATVARVSRWPPADQPHGRLDDIVASTVTLLEQHADVIRTSRPRTLFNRCGYLLHDVLSADGLDLARLLVGSEGTLGVFTEATLRTIPLSPGRAVALLSFTTLDGALRGGRLALESAPAACELLDRRLVRLVGSEARGGTSLTEVVPVGAEAVLLVEYEADSPGKAGAAARALVDQVQRGSRLAFSGVVGLTEEECDRLRQVRESALSGLFALRGRTRPLTFLEDVGVPPEALSVYLPRVQDILRRHEVSAAFLIHAATGHVQMWPFGPLTKEAEPGGMRSEEGALWDLAQEVYSLALSLGGTISARHGTGLARTPWVEQQYGSLAPVFRELKAIFDPHHLFNPGKIVEAGRPSGETPRWPLRRSAFTAPRQELPMLHWEASGLAVECAGCNGCGECRTEECSPATGDSAPPRMCPIFRALKTEAATPRAKANLMRLLLQPECDPRLVSSDEVRAIADLCVNCKMCVRECPARVDVPRLMLELKAANVARHGLDRSDWVLARTENFARLGSRLAPLANALLVDPVSRWVLEKVFGLSRRRRLPAFAARSFLHRARQHGWTRQPRSSRPRVAYFVDVFANYIDPLVAEAVVAVLHHHGIEVYVPPQQTGCGMAPLASGDLETAREAVNHNLRILGDLAREGFPILCSEPTAALMLRHDALDLTDDPDARLVAGQTVEFTSFLWDLHQRGALRTDFAPLEVTVGHHVPCHLKALGRAPSAPALLGLIPGFRASTIDVSCSGMAGTFGLKAANYEVSMEAGRPMLTELARPRYLLGSTECSACRLQMEDGTGKRTLHPAQYLALAYGLLPELQERLRRPTAGRRGVLK
jgi:FAD/FMN-containing dehydrogenase/Fe-S oxidoreductase